MSEKLNNNIILFPGALNDQLKELETKLLKTQKLIAVLMDDPNWDVQPLDDIIIEQLAEYGDVMSFKDDVARRLIACLATELGKQRLYNAEIEHEY